MFIHTTSRSGRLGLHVAALLFGLMALGSLGGCAAATAVTAKTSIQPLIAAQRVTPPRPGKNTVYVLFEDRTAEFADRQYEIEDAIMDAVEGNGWICSDDYDSANYVLWATVRTFGEGGIKEANARAATLGGIAGGAIVAGGVSAAGGSNTVAVASGLASGSITTMAIDYLNREYSYNAIIDLMLGQKVNEEGVTTHVNTRHNDGLGSSSGAGGGFSTESGNTLVETIAAQSVDIMKPHLEMEARLVAVAKGRRLEKTVARDALVPKIVYSIQAHLPRGGPRR